jgi:hypothetical protein
VDFLFSFGYVTVLGRFSWYCPSDQISVCVALSLRNLLRMLLSLNLLLLLLLNLQRWLLQLVLSLLQCWWLFDSVIDLLQQAIGKTGAIMMRKVRVLA